MARGLIHPLTGGRRIRPTSPSSRSARQLKPGRPSTYQAEDAVQTNRASSVAQRVAQVPGDRLNDQRRLEMAALEVVLGPALQLRGDRVQDHGLSPARRQQS